jgi:hypothetical protein
MVAIPTRASKLLIREFAEEMPMDLGFLFPIGKTRTTATSVFADAARATLEERLRQLPLPQNAFTFL